VRCHGLDPIVGGSALAADGLMMNDMKSDKEVALLEELGTQCARALRNLSVNRKFTACDVHCAMLCCAARPAQQMFQYDDCIRSVKCHPVRRHSDVVCAVKLMMSLLHVSCSVEQDRDPAAGRLPQPAGADELPQ
jgi:hypothetical protein